MKLIPSTKYEIISRINFFITTDPIDDCTKIKAKYDDGLFKNEIIQEVHFDQSIDPDYLKMIRAKLNQEMIEKVQKYYASMRDRTGPETSIKQIAESMGMNTRGQKGADPTDMWADNIKYTVPHEDEVSSYWRDSIRDALRNNEDYKKSMPDLPSKPVPTQKLFVNMPRGCGKTNLLESVKILEDALKNNIGLSIVPAKGLVITKSELYGGKEDMSAVLTHCGSVKITNVEFYNDKVTKVTFSDGTFTKAVCGDNDTFNKDVGISICVMKKMLGGQKEGTTRYMAILNHAHKVVEERQKAKEQHAKEQAEQKARRQKAEIRKQKKKERARKAAINDQIDAIVQAHYILENNKEAQTNMLVKEDDLK